MVIRTIVKKRIGPDGKEIDCENDEDRWVDIKETKKTKYERGRGHAFQRTVYTYSAISQRRKYDENPKITFKNPDDENTEIPYLKDKGDNHGTVRSYWVEAGRGHHYRRTKITFDNSENNTRRSVREQRVENEETGDYIIVERIKSVTKETGRGRTFSRKKIHLVNSEENIKDMEGDCKEVGNN